MMGGAFDFLNVPAEGRVQGVGLVLGGVEEGVAAGEAVRALGLGLASFAKLMVVRVVIGGAEQNHDVATQARLERVDRGRRAA